MTKAMQAWKDKVSARLAVWLPRIRREGIQLSYAFLGSMALFPVIEALKTGDYGFLAGTVQALGLSMIGNQIQALQDKGEKDVQAEMAQRLAEDAGLLKEMDQVLNELEVVKEILRQVSEEDRGWFVQTLQESLQAMGSSVQIDMLIQGDAQVFQGSVQNVVGPGGKLYDIQYIEKAYFYMNDGNTKQKDEGDAFDAYLSHLYEKCQLLPLVTLGKTPDVNQEITLDEVYIDLDVAEKISETALRKEGDQVRRSEEKERALKAVETFALNKRMVLLGEPGSGKSTFARRVLSRQAGFLLQKPGHFPVAENMERLLPLLIELRDLIPLIKTLPKTAETPKDRRSQLLKIVHSRIEKDLGGLAESCLRMVVKNLTRGSCLLVLDGLDEAPEKYRRTIFELVQALLDEYHVQCMLVTCRVRSYTGSSKLAGFPDYTLAPFNREQIERYCTAWYQAQLRLKRIQDGEQGDRAQDLAKAALGKDLIELSENPMMLTSMAIVHLQKTRLPGEKVKLYQLVVQILLNDWQKLKMGAEQLEDSSELEQLLADEIRMQGILERFAYEAHRVGRGRKEAADLEYGKAVKILKEELGDLALAESFLSYIDQRAGLLVGHGGTEDCPDTYRFPHRTFQEYLAGCYIFSQEDVLGTLMELAREPEYWSLAVELGMGDRYHNADMKARRELRSLAYLMLGDVRKTKEPEDRLSLWCSKIVCLLGKDYIEKDPSPLGGSEFIGKLITRQVSLLSSRLTPPERADAGRALAMLGDPRFNPDAWFLPAEPLLGFVPIPEGRFWMGSDPQEDKDSYDDEQPLHEVNLAGYALQRYPVTVDQFRFYLEASGYPDYDPDLLQDPGNHPVRWVSWHEALAYCRWLEAELKASPNTPAALKRLLDEEGWTVTLPSEAQWEKAARGGGMLPGLRESAPLRNNPNPRRIYAWEENEFDPDKANTGESRLGDTSVAGCFPRGASPYGLQDLCGNVWEWTRSLWGEDFSKTEYRYPYYESWREREKLDAPDGILRVQRGGSWDVSQGGARCAYRYGSLPSNRDDDYGFRVALSPSTSVL